VVERPGRGGIQGAGNREGVANQRQQQLTGGLGHPNGRNGGGIAGAERGLEVLTGGFLHGL